MDSVRRGSVVALAGSANRGRTDLRPDTSERFALGESRTEKRMRRYWFTGTAPAFLAGIALTLAAQALIDDVTRAEEAWIAARMAGDKTAYAALLSEEFTWTFVTGRVTDKQQTVDNLRAAPSPETSKAIRVYRDAAVVVGTARLMFEGRPITERFVRVWAKSGDGWRAVLFQATEIRQ